ncbi:beta-1,3-galactosyl-O-glycosyl-glycoprotein beta-1,6-N-acetylglucosaminyltransferase 3-like [Spea bombifrons]|uniref:beta-1,3-galactosyl-O-glycosyl-glycoprotein beta-1,6-N-acetylglucosaminyltransferase 3-like n=1 Tax=Spea bombifrons TaxID=233779 RepID=UPI00234C0040|nr:beta-1,3-galactosyl-O-glycosyl-glycoprotein beta-1,6-N-acetylglucosaminyltransferase 3-like [Spea bombifrons]
MGKIITVFQNYLLQRKLRTLFGFGCILIVCTTAVIVSLKLKRNLYSDINGYDGNTYCEGKYYKTLNLLAGGHKNCTKIIRGDEDEVRKTLIDNLIVKNRRTLMTEADYITLTKDCDVFKTNRKYILFSISKEEEEFPIAYSMVIHDSIELFERLLRTIYTPQNVYCVHVDEKSSDMFKKAVRAITSCFENVFIASKLETVVYASWSRVQADLNCMEDLLQSNVRWKYVINTCGADFPLKTNAEIVKALKSLNGKNSMESEKPPAFKTRRWNYHHEVNDGVRLTSRKKENPPLSVPIFSGNAYIVVSREFVKSLFENPIVKPFMKWAEDTYSPDEYFWATLQRLPGMPGFMPQHQKFDTSDFNAIARLVKWESLEGDVSQGAPYTTCTGIHRRLVCVYGTGDLHWMLQQHHLLANKFDPKVDDHAIQCLEEYLRHKSFCPDYM